MCPTESVAMAFFTGNLWLSISNLEGHTQSATKTRNLPTTLVCSMQMCFFINFLIISHQLKDSEFIK